MRRSGSSSGVGGLARAPRQVLAKATPARAARNGVAAVASVSAGAHQPEGARRGGKEAAEVACADRDEGASEDQAPEEDLARQVETRHACPAALRGRSRARRQDLKMLQDARTQRWARSHSDGGLSAAKTIAMSVSCSNNARQPRA